MDSLHYPVPPLKGGGINRVHSQLGSRLPPGHVLPVAAQLLNPNLPAQEAQLHYQETAVQ